MVCNHNSQGHPPLITGSNSFTTVLEISDGLSDFLTQILPEIPFFICLPLTTRFQGSAGGAIHLTAEAFSRQVQYVVPTFS